MQSEDIKTIRLVVNADKAQDNLRQLKNRLVELQESRKKIEQAGDTKGLRIVDKEIRGIQKSIATATARSVQLEQTLRRLDSASPKQLRETISVINKELNSGKVKRGTEEWQVLTRQLVAAKGALRDVNRELSASGEKGEGFFSKFRNYLEGFNHLNWAGMAIDRLSGFVKNYVEQAATMREAEAEVAKYTGLSQKEVEALNAELRKMDTRTPREQLNALAADAGRLGIKGKENLLDFVRTADQINLALGKDLGEDGVKNIGKLAQLFEPDAPLGKSMLRTASLINELAQSSSASEGYILDFTARLAGVGRQAGITQANIAGYASILDQSMMGQERAATALSNIITAIYRHPEEMAKKAGLNVKEFTELLRRDANAALLQFIGALSNAGSLDSIAPMLDEMKLSGSGVTQTLTVLASQIEKVKETQAQASAAYAKGSSATQEAAKANSTLQAELEKVKKRTHEQAVALGNELAPSMKYLTTTSDLLVRFLLLIIHAISQAPLLFLGAAIAMGGYTVAVKVNTAATFLWGKATATARGFMSLYIVTLRAAQVAYFTLTGAVNKAAAAQRLLANATKATPWGIALGVITALIGVMTTLISRSRELSAEQRAQIKMTGEIIDAQNRATNSTIEEKKRIELLNAIMRDNTRSIGDRQRAIADLRKIIPSYHGEISREGKLLRDNAAAIDNYIEKLDNMALAEVLFEKIKANAARKVNADIAIDAWKKGIQNRESLMRSAGHERKTVQVVVGAEDGRPEILTRETNPTRVKDEQQLQYSKQRLKFWEDEKKGILAAERTLNGYIRRKKGLQQAVENVALKRNGSSGISSLPDASSGGFPPSSDKGKDSQKKSEDNRRKKEIEAITQHAQLRSDIARIAYLQGKKSKQEYEEELIDIEDESLSRQLSLYRVGSAARIEIERKQEELLAKIFEQRREWSLAQIEVEENDERQYALESFLSGAIEEKEYQRRLDEIKLNALHRRSITSRQWLGNEHRDTRAAEQEEETERVRQQLERHKLYQQQLVALRKNYAEKSAEERMQEEMSQLEAIHAASLISEDEHQRLLQLIKRRYQGVGGVGGELSSERDSLATQALEIARQQVTGEKNEQNFSPTADILGVGAIGAAAARITVASRVHQQLALLEAQGVITHQQAEDAKEKITQQHYANIRELATASFATVGALSQQLVQLNTAERDYELSLIEQHYAQRVKIVGQNSEQSRQLEEDKQAEIAKVKTKYAEREAKMQIAQAIAQTAVNAISAYGSVVKVPFVGPVLAIAAAAAAVAAGAVQIATIRKQAAAQATGYYSGGFTGGKEYRREAGVVHEGEFVANHEAVNNPRLLPIFQLIDAAQRSHRVAQLTAEDISAVVTQPHAAAANSIAQTTTSSLAVTHSGSGGNPLVVPAENPRTTEVLERLAASLEAGISATVALSGRDGLHEQYSRYQHNLKRK